MGALGLVEAQGAGEVLENAVGDAAGVAALHPDVVIDAHSREHRDLFPAQPGHPPVAAVHGQAGLLRCDPGTPGDEEVTDLVSAVHGYDAMSGATGLGGPAVTWIVRNCLVGVVRT